MIICSPSFEALIFHGETQKLFMKLSSHEMESSDFKKLLLNLFKFSYEKKAIPLSCCDHFISIKSKLFDMKILSRASGI